MSCNGKTSGGNSATFRGNFGNTANFGKKSGNSAISDLCEEYKCCNNDKDCNSGTML